MAGREKRPLGDRFGLAAFGVNHTRLAPGGQSALHHRHSKQDEFIYVLEGEPTLVSDDGETQLRPGMCAGFAAGGGAHHLENRTSRDVVILEVGESAARRRSLLSRRRHPGRHGRRRQMALHEERRHALLRACRRVARYAGMVAWRALGRRRARDRLGRHVLGLRDRAHDALGAGDRRALHAQLFGLCGDLALESLARLGELFEPALEFRNAALDLGRDLRDLRRRRASSPVPAPAPRSGRRGCYRISGSASKIESESSPPSIGVSAHGDGLCDAGTLPERELAGVRSRSA